MNEDLFDRAEDMLIRPDDDLVQATAMQLNHWIANNTAAVRSLGAKSGVRAIVSIVRGVAGERIECGFTGARGALYTTVLIAAGQTDLAACPAQVDDATAALTALAALLQELGLQATLS